MCQSRNQSTTPSSGSFRSATVDVSPTNTLELVDWWASMCRSRKGDAADAALQESQYGPINFHHLRGLTFLSTVGKSVFGEEPTVSL